MRPLGVKLAAKLQLLLTLLLMFSAAGSLAQNTTNSNIPQLRSSARQESAPKLLTWTGDYNFELGGANFSEGRLDEGVASYLTLRSRLDYRLLPWLKVHLAPRLDLYSQRVQQRFDADDSSQSTIRLTEGYLSAQPVEFFEARAGAIGQRFLAHPMLVSSRRSFPGFQEILSHRFGSVEVAAQAQQVVPTSYSLNSERMEREQLPSFSTQSLHLNGNHQLVEWGAVGGRYEWSRLPNKIAFESFLSGNTADGELAPGSQFSYEFAGWFWSSSMAVGKKGVVQGLLEYQGLRNDRAPSDSRDAELLGFGVRTQAWQAVVDVIYRRFYAESDATVSSYGFSRLGNTNRIGDNVEMKVDFPKSKFAVFGEWYNARTINASATQFTMNSFYFGVETYYAPF